MPVDKNLFLHNLAVVAIMKNEGPYIKEWLDYHLLAGVDHFYIYDNESPDNQAEVAKPYVAAGLVDYIPAPGKNMQYIAYNDAIKRFKFQSRYMAFIDGDEFVYPKVDRGGGISEVVDEILSHYPNAAGLAINWQLFGANGQEKADYSRGVLERFTQRVKNIPASEALIKTITNPRKINLKVDAHCQNYFENFYSVNENGYVVPKLHGVPISAKKIVINHYHTKSLEEYQQKLSRGPADGFPNYGKGRFELYNNDGEFDDGILRYRAERAKSFRPPDKSHADERLFSALASNLSPTLVPTTPPQFYAGKLETFLTCRAVAAYLQTKLTDNTPAKFFEEASLKAIFRTLASDGMTFADAQLLLREMPNLLSLPYSVINEIRSACFGIIPQMIDVMRLNKRWTVCVELDYLNRLLQTWK